MLNSITIVTAFFLQSLFLVIPRFQQQEMPCVTSAATDLCAGGHSELNLAVCFACVSFYSLFLFLEIKI